MLKTLRARLVAYEPNGARIKPLPKPLSFDMQVTHDDMSSMRMSYSRNAIGGGILKRGLEQGLEIAVEVADMGGAWAEPDNCRFLLTQRSRNAQDETDTVTLTLQPMAWLSTRILNNDASHLLADGDNKGKRAFLSSNPGTILGTIMDENQGRGGAANTLARGFDTGKDTAGVAWKSVYTLYYSLGTPLSSMLQSMVGGNAIDWRTRSRTLNLYNADSPALCRDLSNTVRVSLRHDVLAAPEEESIEEVASDILVEGDNGLIFRQSNPAAPTPWGKWESYVSQGGVSDTATAKAFMQSTLQSAARVRGQYTRTLLVTSASTLPLLDYHPGDWITAPTVAHGEKVRIQQINISLDSDGLKASITLNDKFYDASVRQARKVNGITGGASLAGSEGGRPAPENDHRVAKAPAGLIVATDAYIDSAGNARGLASLQWAQVTQATDNTAIDISGYHVGYRKSIAGAPWLSGGSSDASVTSLGVGMLECGVRYEFRVRATPTYSDKPGAWCDPVVALIAEDVTPPSVPSTPILTSDLGTVIVHWDGKTADGGTMESDWDRNEVGVSDHDGDYAYRDSLLATGYLYITGMAAGDVAWVSLRSVDRSGNKSDWSTGASVTVASAVTPEEIAQINQDLAENDEAMTQAAKDIAANTTKLTELDSTLTTARSDLDANTDAIADANIDLEQAKADIVTANGKLSDNAAAISAANEKLTQAQSDISANTDAIAGVNSTLSETNQTLATVKEQSQKTTNDLATANGKLDTAQSDITKAKQDIASNAGAIQTANENISAASSKAQTAIDKVNSVGTTVDGLHNVYQGPDDPTTLSGAQVRIGDTWRRTQPYWTRWDGDPNNSTSLLADFYTYWEGAPNNSPSVLVTLDSRIVDVSAWDGLRWNSVDLIARNVLATGTITGDLIAANTIRGNSIIAGSVTADRLTALSITSDYIAANAVVAGKIAANAVTAREIKALSVTSDLLAASSVVAGKIAANAVTADSIAANSVNASKIVAGSITSEEIAANTIVAGNLAANSVNTSEIVAGAVTSDSLAANAVTAGKIVSGAVTTDKLAANSVNASKIVAGSITGDEIAANAIGADELAANSVNAGKIVSGAVTTDKLAANSVNASKIVAGSITGDEIAANAVTGVKINSRTITADKIAAGAITAYEIKAGSITGDSISANAIDGKTITGATIIGGQYRTTSATSGQRLAITSSGLWGVDADNNNTIHLDGSGDSNLLTGTFQTSASGRRVRISPDYDMYAIGGDVTYVGSGVEFPLSGSYASAPSVASYDSASDTGPMSGLALFSGYRSAGTPGAFGRLWSKKNADGNLESESYFTANTEYSESSTTDSGASARMYSKQGYGGRLWLEAWSPSATAQAWIGATGPKADAMLVARTDSNYSTRVGVEADASIDYLFLTGMLGGYAGGKSTFISRHWLCWTGGSGTGGYSNVKFSFTPPPSGGYSFIAAADSPTQNCQVHACYISSSGGEVTGYGQYGGDVYVSLFGWRRA